jgi:hypothetical protein
VRYNKLNNLMFQMWLYSLESGEPQQTTCLLGPPGIGKTSSGRTLADAMQAQVTSDKALQKRIFGRTLSGDEDAPQAACVELDLSSMLPEDLNGLPFRQEVENADPDEAVTQFVTRFAAHEWLHKLCSPSAYGVLILDDLPAAAPMMQVAARQISLERRVHDHRLSPNVFIIVTGNRREDKSAASTLPAHFRNSVFLTDVQLDVDEWAKWYGRNERRSPLIPAFLRWRLDKLSMLPKDADDRGAFATPRTWAKLGSLYTVAEATSSVLEVSIPRRSSTTLSRPSRTPASSWTPPTSWSLCPPLWVRSRRTVPSTGPRSSARRLLRSSSALWPTRRARIASTAVLRCPRSSRTVGPCRIWSAWLVPSGATR